MTENSPQCGYCTAEATHQDALTGEFTCCGHAISIDAEPLEADHECEKHRTVERHTRGLDCEHQDFPGPHQSPIPCQREAEWEITTEYASGGPGGAPTRTRYCEQHFFERLQEINDE